MAPRAAPNRRMYRALPFIVAGLAFALAALFVGGAPASADTVITASSTSALLIFNASDSPYILDHDFHVLPGGFVLLSDGTDLQVDNGARIYGDGGSLSLTSSSGAPAVVRARVGGNASTWGGFVLQNGSELTLRHSRILDADQAVTMIGIASLDAQFAEFQRCASWCIATDAGASLLLKDSNMTGGGWGLLERGASTFVVDNVTLQDFTDGALWFASGTVNAQVSRVTASNVTRGIQADSTRASTMGNIILDSTGDAVSGSGIADVVFHNSTFTSASGAAFHVADSARVTLRDSELAGATRAVSLDETSAAALLRNNLSAPSGACLWFNNVTNALMRGNVLSACTRALAFGPSSAPPTADVDPSNRFGGKSFQWISNAANVEIGAFDDAGLVVLSAVSGANLTDLRLDGVGIYILGSSNVRVERVLVRNADVALTALGTRGLTLRQFTAAEVGEGISIRSSGFFAAAQDILLDHVRVDATTGDAIMIAGASNVTLRAVVVSAGGSGINLSGVTGAFMDNVMADGTDIGVRLWDTTGVTLVDSVLAHAISYGLRAFNSTGRASRDSFVDNVGPHASATGAPGFVFSEPGFGNYWSGFTGPNVNGDAFYDVPYNLTDGSGQDPRPLIGHPDNEPAAIVVPPPVFDVGAQGELNATSSFDDFGLQNVYWLIDTPVVNDTGDTPLFKWLPNLTGDFVAHVTVLGTFGSDDYAFTVFVRDRMAPTPGALVLGAPELGVNLTVSLTGASDNDPSFPSGASVNWSLNGPSGLHRNGTSPGLSFTVPVDQLGFFTLMVTLSDRSGNSVQLSTTFLAYDTQAPAVALAYTGQPDLGEPFTVDASDAHDPAGVNTTSAFWTWIDGSQVHNSTAFPSLTLTFLDTGIHTLTLRLCDSTANCANTTASLDVRDRSGPRLVVVRIIVPGKDVVEVAPGENIVVEASSRQEVVFEIVATDRSTPLNYTWTFGDGGTATGSRVTHAFNAAGGVTVTVVMTDTAGNVNSSALRMDIAGRSFFDDFPGGQFGVILVFGAVMAAAAGALLFLRARSKKALKEESPKPPMP